MKTIKLRTLTLLFGVVVALSAMAIGTSYFKSYRIAELNSNREIPSVNFIDLNKVFHLIFAQK